MPADPVETIDIVAISQVHSSPHESRSTSDGPQTSKHSQSVPGMKDSQVHSSNETENGKDLPYCTLGSMESGNGNVVIHGTCKGNSLPGNDHGKKQCDTDTGSVERVAANVEGDRIRPQRKGQKPSRGNGIPASECLVLSPMQFGQSQRKLTPALNNGELTPPPPYSKYGRGQKECRRGSDGNGEGAASADPPGESDNHSHLEKKDSATMSHSKSNKSRLMLMFTLTFGFFLVEIIVGYMSNSMALVADSFHMLSDVAALVVAFLAVKMSPKKWSKNTFGWARAEVLGALVNAVFLVALCFSILIESLKRFISPDKIHNPQLVLGVGVAGLVVNLIGICLFHSHGGSGHSHGGHHTIQHQSRLTRMVATDDNENDERVTSPDNAPPPPEIPMPKVHGHSHGGTNMNMRGVFLHLLADALGSVIVIASALIIWLTDWTYEDYVDPALSVIMIVLILNSVWPLLQESAMILLQTVPTHIQIDELQRRLIGEVEGVIAVHEFHIWQLAGDRIIASAHIRCRNLVDYIRIAEKVKEFFHNEGIHSTTIQPEFIEHYPESNGSIQDCFIACPPDDELARQCAANSCCGPQRDTELRPSSVIINE